MTERVLVEVRGIVQGVGFRPYVYSLATSLRLGGFVQNRGSHVLIDVEGEPPAVTTFVRALSASPPALASIERVDCRSAAPIHYDRFVITASEVQAEHDIRIAPDASTCEACLGELFDPRNRRYRYPFINCTACGPRYTIVTGSPYDRARTTMRRFAMCAACRREYEDPADRRFHAEPIACRACGPQLSAREAPSGAAVAGDPIKAAGAVLSRGGITAVKGLGGYHLACDATDEAAVEELRRRKRRDAKPFAIMVAADALNLASIPELARALHARQRPIVLLPRGAWREGGGGPIAPNVAPGSPSVGVMLPYTPLHWLLVREIGRPLVMTSGNTSDEPIAYEDADAWTRLRAIADLFLVHDRPVHVRCDDSVTRIVAGAPALVRRARGYAPEAIELSEAAAEPVLGLGGHLKNTFCFLSGRRASLSPHVGDLENAAAYAAFRGGIEHYARLMGVTPLTVAHDLHPDYLSSRFAEEFPAENRYAVQHHHAHVLSCAAEHGVVEPVLGVAFDGAGMGPDGTVWGGEFLYADGTTYQRFCHLGCVPLPGGDAAAREPWRMALAHLIAAFGDLGAVSSPLFTRISENAIRPIRQMIMRGIASPPTSSAGRLFDAVAALAGVRDRAAFEGQAAMELEALAGTPARPYPFDIDTDREPWTLGAAPAVRAVVEDVNRGRPPEEIASAFHNGLAEAVAEVCARGASRWGVRQVALSGGVFQNAVLTERAVEALHARSLQPLVHRRVPCNDGGLSLGQAVFAARALRQTGSKKERHACV